jgi:hypothetical protein
MKKVKDLKTYYFECSCYTQDHVLGIAFDIEDKEMYIFTQLNPHVGFFTRLLYAAKYVLGFRAKTGTGHWEETLLMEDKIVELQQLLNRFAITSGFQNKGSKQINKAINQINNGKPNTLLPATHKEDLKNKQQQQRK